MNPETSHPAGGPSTIAAVASPPGSGAVSLIRISGPAAAAIAAAATGGHASSPTPRRATLTRILDAGGETIDDGLLTLFPAPHSFTGETCVEFTGHGGMLVTREVLARFLECGARPAEPGEFTQRAFLNGKLDLTQAEAVMDLINARTRLALRAAREQLDGEIGRQTTALRDALLATLAHLEAWIDFPEEDIDPKSGQALLSSLRQVLQGVETLLATADQGRILREGVRTVLCGPPNAGKSSLLNRLLGFERAIVSEIPGTTRDTIEEIINLHGIPLRLIDTAGMRDTQDQLEAQGIHRTLRQIESADLLLEVADASQPPPPQDEPTADSSALRIRVLNKSDLPNHPGWNDLSAVRISCATGAGIDDLATRIREALHLGQKEWGDHAVAINARHQHSLKTAAHHLRKALESLAHQGNDPALAAIDLRDALDSLGEIPGKLDTEDLLSHIFSTFCIGK